MADINICDLPDDILVHMCTYLSSVDVVSFSAVCFRFSDLCSQKPIVRTLDFRRCYSLLEPTLKIFLKPRIRCANIHALNLNHCYWLTPALLGSLSKLKNLKELHLLDCKVTAILLTKIVVHMELNALSWTWHQLLPSVHAPLYQPTRTTQKKVLKDQGFEPLQDCLSHLRHLVLHLSFLVSFPEINSMLQLCPNLESLELYEFRFERSCRSEITYFFLHDQHPPRNGGAAPCLPKLRKLQIWITSPQQRDFYDLVFSWVIPAKSSWEELWFQIRGNELINYWHDQGKLTDADLRSFDALSLSGVRHIGYRFDTEHRNNEVALSVLDHGSQLKCRKLSLDRMKMNAGKLHAIAHQCPFLKYLSMKNCEFINHSVDVVHGLKDISEHCQKITHLNLARTNIYSQDEYPCLALANLTNLKSLSITTSMLVIIARNIETTSMDNSRSIRQKSFQVGLEKNRRIGVQTSPTEASLRDSCLWLLTENCPHIVKLEIYQSKPLPDKVTVSESTLACILRWRGLKHLGLYSIMDIRHGNFLCDILKHCQNLLTLKLKNLGSLSACVYVQPLMQGLKFAISLKDLSIHQVNFNITTNICRGLENCSTLERLALFCPGSAASELRVPDVFNMVLRLPKLIMLYMLLRTSNAFCKGLMQNLLRFQEERHAFSCMVSNEGKHFLQCPAVHTNEMLLTRVGKHKALGCSGYSCTF